MANILVLGVDTDAVYEQARGALAAGHNVSVALTREVAFRKLLSGLIDTLILDCPLGPEAQTAMFRRLRAAVPGLPPCWPQGAALPSVADAPSTPAAGRSRPTMTDSLMRAIAHCFGVAEGRRLGVPADVEIRCDGVTRFGALATAMRGREVVIEFLDPAASDALLGVTLLGTRVPATVWCHFAGGGVLRVDGTVEAGWQRRGIASLKLTATPDEATAPAPAAPTVDPAAALIDAVRLSA